MRLVPDSFFVSGFDAFVWFDDGWCLAPRASRHVCSVCSGSISGPRKHPWLSKLLDGLLIAFRVDDWSLWPMLVFSEKLIRISLWFHNQHTHTDQIQQKLCCTHPPLWVQYTYLYFKFVACCRLHLQSFWWSWALLWPCTLSSNL